jgi:hypothetical protein
MKPEDKHFKGKNELLLKTKNIQKTGSGKKFGAPVKTEGEKK